MSIVTLVSGGLDSTLMAILVNEEKIKQYPLFIDYGQLSKEKELQACLLNHKTYNLPRPNIMKLEGFGKIISSGLTNSKFDVNEDAFLPNRNLLFLLAGSSYAYQTNSITVAIGLLNDESHIFPDQTKEFIEKTQGLIAISLGISITIIAPLIHLSKHEAVRIAKEKGIQNTYSCHSGNKMPCGKCISCLEILNSQ